MNTSVDRTVWKQSYGSAEALMLNWTVIEFLVSAEKTVKLQKPALEPYLSFQNCGVVSSQLWNCWTGKLHINKLWAEHKTLTLKTTSDFLFNSLRISPTPTITLFTAAFGSEHLFNHLLSLQLHQSERVLILLQCLNMRLFINWTFSCRLEEKRVKLDHTVWNYNSYHVERANIHPYMFNWLIHQC